MKKELVALSFVALSMISCKENRPATNWEVLHISDDGTTYSVDRSSVHEVNGKVLVSFKTSSDPSRQAKSDPISADSAYRFDCLRRTGDTLRVTVNFADGSKEELSKLESNFTVLPKTRHELAFDYACAHRPRK